MSITNPHNFPGDARLTKKIVDKVATLYFYQNVIVMEATSGAKINYKTGFPLLVQGVNFIDNKPFVYISNRINKYDYNIKDLRFFQLAPYIKGVAIVTQELDNVKEKNLARNYFKKPFEIFNNLDDAYRWTQQLLSSEKST